MKTGIVILNYNDYENTIKMINQIKDYNNISKIVIVDNQSNDGSVEQLKPLENKKIIILEAKKNEGYAKGNNIGLKYLESETDCELAIISNPDILVDESIIDELIKDFKKNPNISFLGPKILERGTISRGWKHPTFTSELLSNINYFSRYEKKLLRYEQSDEHLRKVDVIHGCFFVARIKDFKKIHYFDPNTFLYYEENILAKKASKEGLETYVDNYLSVEHALSQSVDKSLKKIKKYKILKKSMFYYEDTYCNRNIFQKILLKLTYYISLGILYLTFWI